MSVKCVWPQSKIHTKPKTSIEENVSINVNFVCMIELQFRGIFSERSKRSSLCFQRLLFYKIRLDFTHRRTVLLCLHIHCLFYEALWRTVNFGAWRFSQNLFQQTLLPSTFWTHLCQACHPATTRPWAMEEAAKLALQLFRLIIRLKDIFKYSQKIATNMYL